MMNPSDETLTEIGVSKTRNFSGVIEAEHRLDHL